MKKTIYLCILISLITTSCSLSERLSAAWEAFMTAPEEQIPDYSDLEGIGCIPDLADVEEAQMVRVIDGDSIEVLLDGEKFEVRYIGINTPEYYSDERDAAIKATDANKKLVAGKTIYMFRDHSDTDNYGRLLRYVLTDDAFVNLELVREGFAKAREYPPDTACHELFEKAAQ